MDSYANLNSRCGGNPAQIAGMGIVRGAGLEVTKPGI